MKYGAVLVWILLMSVTNSYAENPESSKKFTISLNQAEFSRTGRLVVNGKFSVFVKCGSQLAVWASFPRDVEFKITDQKTGKQYISARGPEFISYRQLAIESYAKLPCAQVVEKEFIEDLAEKLWFPTLPELKGAFTIEAEYHAVNSNILSVPPLSQ